MPWGNPRERAMPLVPQPFSEVHISRQSVFMGSRPMVASGSNFSINLDIPQYRETLSDKKQNELDQRAVKLERRAISNQLYKASEFCWEVSAWNDVFGLLYNDERFLIDKRPYEFLEIDDLGNEVVKKRIPDATIGLKSYDTFLLKRGYVCTVSDCEEDHSTMQPDKRLWEHDLKTMMHDPECGLIVDGVWGKTELLFPFAVYEAKKRASQFQEAEHQIYHACRTYLAMLDDLARNPDNVAEYQTEESSKYQLFAFASCGSFWEVFVAWNMQQDCMVETIWEGNVQEFSRAFDLICIVDQIQDYAVNHHRPFVMKHLEAWHARHQKKLQPIKKVMLELDTAIATQDAVCEDSGITSFDSDDSDSNSDKSEFDFDFGDIDNGPHDFIKFSKAFGFGPYKPAEWLRLKEQSKNARHQMASETRNRNRSLKIAQATEPAKELQKTRPRGRPRKAGITKQEAPKRGRGRPPKIASKIIKTGLKQ